MLEHFAEEVVSKLSLGSRSSPDVLAISFSSNDAIGHHFGPDSAQIADEQIRLDRTIGKLMQFIDARVGKENVVYSLTADHGVQPTPEAERAHGNSSAKRVRLQDRITDAERQLDLIFHAPPDFKWFANTATSFQLHWNREALKERNISMDAAARALATEVKVADIAGFWDAHHVTAAPDWIRPFLENSYFPTNSGDVYYVPDK